MCTYIKDDPAAILIDGQPMPQLWTNITTGSNAIFCDAGHLSLSSRGRPPSPFSLFSLWFAAVAFLTSLTLDLFTWAWTTEPSKAAMFAFPLVHSAPTLLSTAPNTLLARPPLCQPCLVHCVALCLTLTRVLCQAVGTCSFISYLGLAMGYCPLLASFD
eukprot:2304986-Rhodomonas_salina.1